MQRRNVIFLAGLAAASTLVAGCGGSDSSPPAPSLDVVQLAQATPELSILVEAVVAADLVATLKAPGPFTVLAPTNSAFASLLAELGVTKDQLLADKPLLTVVLTYHVVGARVERSQIPLGKAVSTVQGGIFKVDSAGNVLTITDGRNRNPKIITTDLQASNGLVHVVDKVLLPADKTIVQTAQALPQFSILVEAVIAANLQATLSGSGPFTVFAPTNDAFAALLTELGVSKDILLANTALLTRVLTYHVLAGRVLKADIPIGANVAT
ncbi:MAG: fasciclin domain-containing protein, partial [Polaromonas sp.]|nr:fasciclin domain-containing protein [Polaromonas sp.]